jgi:hypothetical protein
MGSQNCEEECCLDFGEIHFSLATEKYEALRTSRKHFHLRIPFGVDKSVLRYSDNSQTNLGWSAIPTFQDRISNDPDQAGIL